MRKILIDYIRKMRVGVRSSMPNHSHFTEDTEARRS